MSDKLPMYNVEKIRTFITIKASTKVKLEKMCDAAGLKNMNQICNVLLDEATRKVALTEEDFEKIHKIVVENIRSRKEKKAKKGIR